MGVQARAPDILRDHENRRHGPSGHLAIVADIVALLATPGAGPHGDPARRPN